MPWPALSRNQKNNVTTYTKLTYRHRAKHRRLLGNALNAWLMRCEWAFPETETQVGFTGLEILRRSQQQPLPTARHEPRLLLLNAPCELLNAPMSDANKSYGRHQSAMVIRTKTRQRSPIVLGLHNICNADSNSSRCEGSGLTLPSIELAGDLP